MIARVTVQLGKTLDINSFVNSKTGEKTKDTSAIVTEKLGENKDMRVIVTVINWSIKKLVL